MLKAMLTITHTEPQKDQRHVQKWAFVLSAECDARWPEENKIWFTRTGISILNRGGGTQNNLVHSVVRQNNFVNIIAADKNALDCQCQWWKISSFFTPPASFLNRDKIKKKRESIVYAWGRSWRILWGTSLGSKPCSDSCLVNHLRKSQQQSSHLRGTIHSIHYTAKLSPFTKISPTKFIFFNNCSMVLINPFICESKTNVVVFGLFSRKNCEIEHTEY